MTSAKRESEALELEAVDAIATMMEKRLCEVDGLLKYRLAEDAVQIVVSKLTKPTTADVARLVELEATLGWAYTCLERSSLPDGASGERKYRDDCMKEIVRLQNASAPLTPGERK